jgi:glycosyltransferase involved in cell wall biosynthesis
LIRWERFDIVHTHCRNADLIGGLAARIAGVNTIIMHARGLYLNSEGKISKSFVDRFHRIFLRYIPVRIVAISDAVRQESIRVLKVSPYRVTLIPHAIDHKRFQSVSEKNIKTLKRSMNIDSSNTLLLSIGSLNKSKGYDVLLEAISKLRNNYSVKLALVGDGPERNSLEKLTDELGLKYCVTFLGVRKDISTLLQSCDIFVHPARWEGFGRVIAEAMAMGRPVIASEVGGIPEIIINGQSGLLVPPNNSYALASAIQRLIDNPLFAESLALKGLNRSRRYFSIERSSHETAQFLCDVVKKFGSRRSI